MATLRTLGNGDRGYFLDIAVCPTPPFETELDALAGTTPPVAGHADLSQLETDLGCRNAIPTARSKLG